jgi:hypothetical protein
MKIKEHDCVVLTADLPGERLETGDVGTVIRIHNGGDVYEVKFAALDGHTLTVATVESQKLRPGSPTDVVHVRELGRSGSLSTDEHFAPSQDKWESGLSDMAADPEMQKELSHINSEFSATEADGLGKI